MDWYADAAKSLSPALILNGVSSTAQYFVSAFWRWDQDYPASVRCRRNPPLIGHIYSPGVDAFAEAGAGNHFTAARTHPNQLPVSDTALFRIRRVQLYPTRFVARACSAAQFPVMERQGNAPLRAPCRAQR